MKKTYLLGGGIAVLTAAILAGCNGNDDDGAPAAASTTQVTITPSLGKILGAKVIARNATTGVEIGSGNTGNTGVATFNVTQTSAPVIFEVQGSATAKYVDESKLSATNNGETNFDATQKIRVAVPALTANIGVSTLTEVAYQAALKKASNDEKAISAAIATASNEAIRKALAPELTSITVTPTVIGSLADLAAIQNTEAGKYALKLAALAKLVPDTNAAPAIAALKQLAADITSDDKLDGIATGQELAFNYTAANLVSSITNNLNITISGANLTGFNTAQFTPVPGNIVITVSGTGGGTGSGQDCMANIAYSGLPVIGSMTYKVCYSNFPQNAVCGSGNSTLAGLAQSVQVPGAAGGGTVTVNYTFSSVANCASSGANVTVNYAN
jgi:hypothetical protein